MAESLDNFEERRTSTLMKISHFNVPMDRCQRWVSEDDMRRENVKKRVIRSTPKPQSNPSDQNKIEGCEFSSYNIQPNEWKKPIQVGGNEAHINKFEQLWNTL